MPFTRKTPVNDGSSVDSREQMTAISKEIHIFVARIIVKPNSKLLSKL
jgi:hypothetical protein